MSAERQLASGIAALGLDLAAGTEAKLLAYLKLLSKWNHTYNLTSVHDETAMVSHHLLDSLSVLPHLDRGADELRTLADLGSGGGLPGIPLALARPGLSVTLIESSQKKASFLQQAKIELGLANVTVCCTRVEAFMPPSLFEAVISRAYAALTQFVASAAHLLTPGGRLLAMKGRYPAEEIADMTEGWKIEHSVPLAVPGLAGERHLIVITRA